MGGPKYAKVIFKKKKSWGFLGGEKAEGKL